MATWQCAVAPPLTLPFLVLPYATAVKIFWVPAMLAAAGGMFALARRALPGRILPGRRPVFRGRSKVLLNYSPPAFRLGLFLSFIGLTITLLAGLDALFSARHTC